MKIKILHITRDDKFFDSVFLQFETDRRLENEVVLEVKNKTRYKFRRIRNTEKVNLVSKKEMRNILRKGKYDVLFFYSMPEAFYKYFNWIPNDKIVIWWGWGYEIYKSIYGLEPLISLSLYKPLTERVLTEITDNPFSVLKSKIGKFLIRPWIKNAQKKMLRRINYFQPVLSQEFQLMNRTDGFHAKEFYYPNCFPWSISDTLGTKDKAGNILIGNSQAPTNNHLDVWNDIYSFLPERRRLIIPLNYLGDQEYAKLVAERMQSDKDELVFLKDFMKPDDYFALMDSCSYAIFGVLRQQAIGNVFSCLSKGIKVFLYKDSLVYRFLKEDGFVVFPIEDIDSSSFSTPLSIIDIDQNRNAFCKKGRYINTIKEKAFSEIFKQIESD